MLENHEQNNLPSCQRLLGWFAIAYSSEIKNSQTKMVNFMDEAYRLVRGQNGRLHCNDNENIIHEQNNIIYLWRHPHGCSPAWFIPTLTTTTWSSYYHQQFQIHAHPQEVHENAVDMGHFSPVHGYNSLKLLEGPHFHGHTMSIRLSIARERFIFLNTKKTLKANFKVELYGLGSAFNEIMIPDWNLRIRMLVLTTPKTNKTLNLKLAVAIAGSNDNYFKKMIFAFIHRFCFNNIIKDLNQDVAIWQHKIYLTKPLLVKGDGQIMKFRNWCKQFYV